MKDNMEFYKTTKLEQGYQILGLPSDTKILVRILNETSHKLSDLALHRRDLYFAKECLEEINTTENEKDITRTALWNNAIIHLIKCFGNNKARKSFQINANHIYCSEGVEHHIFFKKLRDKHLVHDENSYTQSITGAALNDGNKDYSIEKIISHSTTCSTLTQENWNNLSLLITTALEWVEKQYQELCNELTQELEDKYTYDELASNEALKYKKPSIEGIGKRRRKSE